MSSELRNALDSSTRDTISTKRIMPVGVQEDIASILSYEIISGHPYEIRGTDIFIRKFGIYYQILLYLREDQTWEEIKEICREYPQAGSEIYGKFLNIIFGFIEKFSGSDSELYAELSDVTEETLLKFKDLVDETKNNWDSGEKDSSMGIADVLREYRDILRNVLENYSHNYLVPENFFQLTDTVRNEVSDYFASGEVPDVNVNLLSEFMDSLSGLKDSEDLLNLFGNLDISDGCSAGSDNEGVDSKVSDSSDEGKDGGTKGKGNSSGYPKNSQNSDYDDSIPDIEGEDNNGDYNQNYDGGGNSDDNSGGSSGENQSGDYQSGGSEDSYEEGFSGSPDSRGNNHGSPDSSLEKPDENKLYERIDGLIDRILKSGFLSEKNGKDFSGGTGGVFENDNGDGDSSRNHGGEYNSEDIKNDRVKDEGSLNEFTLIDSIDEIIELIEKLSEPSHGGNQTSERNKEGQHRSFMNGLLSSFLFDEVREMMSLHRPHLETIELLKNIVPGGKWSYSTSDLTDVYYDNLDKYAALAGQNEDLKKILDFIGRINFESGVKKISVSPSGRSEVHSITYSNDISRMLPVESSKLLNPALKKKFYADFLESKFLTYQLRGKHWTSKEPNKRHDGPVVALVDTSGSMSGFMYGSVSVKPEEIAKAVIIAITNKMIKKNRDVKVVLFSGPGQTEEIEMTSRNKMSEEFLDFMSMTFRGGTDFNTALDHGLKSLESPDFNGADLLFITDGFSEINDKELLNRWEELKAERDARVFSMIVGPGKEKKDAVGLSDISDYVYFLNSPEIWDLKNSPARMINIIESPENPEKIGKKQNNTLL